MPNQRHGHAAFPRVLRAFAAILPLTTAGISITARAAPPAPANSPAWFVPPPPAKGSLANGGQRMDLQSFDSREDITVTAERRPIQRNPHGEETRDFQPSHSDAASPTQGSPTQSYCQSAYQTVAGQAATGADMLGMGGGHCD